jgi:hypothetical protein
MTYVLINHAPDGTHNRTFKTETAAFKALADFLGRRPGAQFVVGAEYYSDWGNRLVIEERAAGHTATKETALRKAFDARECGVATKRQLALLDKEGF